MNAYERHIIHAKLQEHASVSTHSVGSEPNRRVVVAYGDRGDGFIPRDRYSAPPRRDGRDRPRTARAPDRDAAPKPEPVREAYDNSSNAYSAAVDSPNYREWK
jgi:hypothetical protein